jgi:hypothetical protein
MRSLARITKSIQRAEKTLDKDFNDLEKLLIAQTKAAKTSAKAGRPKKAKAVKTKTKKAAKVAKTSGKRRGRPPGSKNKPKVETIAPAGEVQTQTPAAVVAPEAGATVQA